MKKFCQINCYEPNKSLNSMVNLNQNKTYLKGIFNSLICKFIFDLNQECKHINALADSSLSKLICNDKRCI